MIWRRFLRSVAEAGGRTAVVAGDERISYEALVGRVEAAASALPEPVGPRPWRAVVRHEDPSWVLIGVLACWRRGFSAVVLRDSMTAAQVADVTRWIRPAAVVEGPSPAGLGRGVPAPVPFGERDEALVICTSGTTGVPKLVALPAQSVCITAETIAAALGLGGDDRVAVNTPLGYMYGLMGGCLASLWAGATCRLFRPRDPLTQLQAAIRREGITVVQGPPSLFRLFLGYWTGEPFPGVRVVTTGGEPLGADLAEGLARAFPNARRLFLYGMTEAGPRISHLSFEDGGGRDACIGVPYGHFEWRLDPVADSPAGRLVLRGPSMFLGYIGADGGYEGLDDRGFFHTNDLVSIGAGGRLHFRGRLDRIFRSGGRLVNPEAIERVLAGHPDVDDAVVRPEEHPLLGLVPVAEVVMKTGVRFDPSALAAACAAAVEPHALPRRIVATDARGLADSGKRQRPAGPAPRS